MGYLSHDVTAVNSNLLLRIPKMPERKIQLTPEQELELMQGIFYMVLDVAPEAQERFEKGDGVYFSEQIRKDELVPVKWRQMVKKGPEDDLATKEDVEYDVMYLHSSRVKCVRRGLYKDDV